MTAHSRPPYDEDDDLDLRALYRTLPRAEPGPAVDAAVHEAAARAAAADRRVWRQRRLWHPGWGVAASIVLTACLFLLTDFRHPDLDGVSDAPPVDAELARPPRALPSPTAPPAAAPARPEAPAALRRYAPAMRADEAPQADNATRAEKSDAPTEPGDATEREAPAESDARIAQIRELLQAGRRDAAVQALRDLRREAPDLALPPDLQALLPAEPR